MPKSEVGTPEHAPQVERKAGLTSEETAKLIILFFLLGGFLGCWDKVNDLLMQPGTYDTRILPTSAAILFSIAGIGCILLDRFTKGLWSLIALPSPLYGTLVCIMLALYEAGKAVENW